MSPKVKIFLGSLLIAALATPALAHPGPIGHADFAGGFAHPFSGWDHMLAMVALGLWLGLTKPAKPIVAFATFVVALGTGFILGLNGFHIPLVESGILASILAFGLLTATAARVPAALAVPVIAIFMVFHGYAHGAEAPIGAASLYALGFIAASVAIVATAFCAAYFIRHAQSDMIVRRIGAVIAIAGVVLGLAS